MKLAEASIRHPVSVIVGVFFVILFGMMALFRIPVQLTPDITRPTDICYHCLARCLPSGG